MPSNPVVADLRAAAVPPNPVSLNDVASDVSSTLVYAGFWRRLLAITIDFLIIAAGFGGIIGLLSLLNESTAPGPDPTGNGLVAFVPLILINGLWFYFMLLESSAWQASIGKKILRLYVTDLEGRRIGLGRATGRTFAKYLSGMPLGIGFIMTGFTKKKQALHDMIANCLVLRRPLRR